MKNNMTAKQQYIAKIQEIMDTKWKETHAALVEATNTYLETTPEEEQDNFDQMDYGTDLSRIIDDLALTRGWIEDRLNHRYPKDRRAITKKIRKILGYSYP
jgi:hypothetical protein